MIRPTGTGGAVAAATALLALAGLTTGYAELLAVAATGAASLVAAFLWVLPTSALTTGRDDRPHRIVEGEPVGGSVHVGHSGRWRSRPATLRVSVAGRTVEATVPSLRAGSSRRIRYELPGLPRGRYEPVPELVRYDPLRTWRRRVAVGSPAGLTVLPRIRPVPLPAPVEVPDWDGAVSTAAPSGAAFHSLRAYEVGDDLRLVHWKSLARTGQLLVRHEVRPDESRYEIVVDPTGPPGGFEDLVRAATSVVAAATAAEHPVRVTVVGTQLGARPALDVLAAVRPSGAARAADPSTDAWSQAAATRVGARSRVAGPSTDAWARVAARLSREPADGLILLVFTTAAPGLARAAFDCGFTDGWLIRIGSAAQSRPATLPRLTGLPRPAALPRSVGQTGPAALPRSVGQTGPAAQSRPVGLPAGVRYLDVADLNGFVAAWTAEVGGVR